MTVSEVCRHSALRALVGARRIQEALPTGRSSSDADSATLLLTTRLGERRSSYQRLAGVGPAIGMSVLGIVPFQEDAQPLLELRRRSEVASFQEAPRQHAEP